LLYDLFREKHTITGLCVLKIIYLATVKNNLTVGERLQISLSA